MSTEIPQGFWHFEKELDMNVSHGSPQNSLGIRSRLCGFPGSIALGTQQLMCCWSFVPDILVDILGLFSVLHGINVQKDIEPPLIVGQDDNQQRSLVTFLSAVAMEVLAPRANCINGPFWHRPDNGRRIGSVLAE